MNIKIMVAAHREFPMPEDRSLYLPVQVGAASQSFSISGYQRDDEGENISKKNPNFNELTAVYWAWKNLDADVIGLVHYRRFFSLSHKRNLEKILNKKQINKLLVNNSIILPKMRRYYIETNYSHYVHAHHKEPLEMTRIIIKEDYPEYLSSFDKVMKRRSAHMFNMFIMKKENFNDYAKWLFDVLFKVEQRIDISGYSAQEARVFGYLSELLMDVWMTANENESIEVNWIQIGDQQILRKIIALIGRKFGLGGKTHF